MKSIRFTGRYRIYFPGDVGSFPAAQADAIVAAGAAVYGPGEGLAKEEITVMPPDEHAVSRRRRA